MISIGDVAGQQATLKLVLKEMAQGMSEHRCQQAVLQKYGSEEDKKSFESAQIESGVSVNSGAACRTDSITIDYPSDSLKAC